MATLNDNHSAQLTTLTDAESTLNPTPTGSTSPGSRPKPSPIATTALRRSTSLSHSATIKSFVPEPMEGGGLTSTEISAENHLNNECFPDEDCQSGRDSGIAIESWGRTSPKADKNLFRGSKDPFPSFDQLFQSSDLEPTDSFQAELVEEKKAENITGLYFAKQMNMKSTSCLYPTPQGLEGSIHGHAESDITIEVNSPSPIANAKHAKETAEAPSLRFGPLFDCGVDRDLEKALYFYQQAADQGHTKASYNLGCICYNLGQADKAIAWFESAGKCSIRGLQPISDVKPYGVLDCPLPKKLSGGSSLLDNDLAEMLRVDHMATSGPFAPYLPAIMCLALLCRQGVQTREGGLLYTLL
ncbi:hypothetical protein BG005_010589 [Podila minutissima]|nr:hypothetical protein BG005_010589 [Podila minutissima]